MSWNIINVGIGLAIPIITGIYYYYHKNNEHYRKNNDIMEVLWTNHLSQICEYSPDQHLPINNLCKKTYCALYKIQRIKNCIENAKYSVDVAMHIFTSDEIANAISHVYKKGVRVRIICCSSQKDSTGSKIWSLSRTGISVLFPDTEGSELMHHKFCIIDGKCRVKSLIKYDKLICKTKPESLLFCGSCNWTRQALNVNWENITITSNDILINKYEEEFERIWMKFRR